MNQSQIAFQKLVSHQFTRLGLHQGVAIAQKLQTTSITKAEVEFVREPDEYEFYLIEVGHTLAHLLGLCEQLIHATLFLSAFTPTKRMKKAGINRASHLQYNIENYLIRTQSLHDRVLKLVNAVFHLGLDSRDCRHDTIAKNLHVKVTNVPINLRSIGNLLEKYRQERNIIVHHESYLEDELRKLEMYYLVQKDGINSDVINQDIFPFITRNLTRKIVEQKTEEFDQFNEAVFKQLELLFDELKPKYEKLLTSLSLKCGHSLSPSD